MPSQFTTEISVTTERDDFIQIDPPSTPPTYEQRFMNRRRSSDVQWNLPTCLIEGSSSNSLAAGGGGGGGGGGSGGGGSGVADQPLTIDEILKTSRRSETNTGGGGGDTPYPTLANDPNREIQVQVTRGSILKEAGSSEGKTHGHSLSWMDLGPDEQAAVSTAERREVYRTSSLAQAQASRKRRVHRTRSLFQARKSESLDTYDETLEEKFERFLRESGGPRASIPARFSRPGTDRKRNVVILPKLDTIPSLHDQDSSLQ